MLGEKSAAARVEKLERVAREVVRASADGGPEVERVASSPFLYARVRAAVEEERRRREEGEGWLGLFAVALRAAPGMALVAAAALGLFLWTGAPAPSPARARLRATTCSRPSSATKARPRDEGRRPSQALARHRGHLRARVRDRRALG